MTGLGFPVLIQTGTLVWSVILGSSTSVMVAVKWGNSLCGDKKMSPQRVFYSCHFTGATGKVVTLEHGCAGFPHPY